MKSLYDTSIPEQASAEQFLEEMVSRTAESYLTLGDPDQEPMGSLSTHTDFTLPDDNGALVVVRFAGEGAVEKAKRLRKLIDAWS